jgi:hypothetical protein
VIVSTGAAAAVTDWSLDRDHPSEAGELRPYEYAVLFGPHRGPPERSHLSCDTTDPISRANHLRAAGWIRQASPTGLADDPTLARQALDQIDSEWALEPDERRFACFGMGTGLADSLHSIAGLRVAGLGHLALRVVEDLGRRDGEAFAAGFVAALPVEQLSELDPETLAWACAATSWGTRPLCRLVGRRFVQPDRRRLPEDPAALLVDPATFPAGAVAADIVSGAAAELARRSPRLERPPHVLDAWPKELADAFRAGWEEERLRVRWRSGDPWEPHLVP